MRDTSESFGWAATGLHDALVRGSLTGLAAWQVAPVMVALFVQPRTPTSLLILMHAGVAALALISARRGWSPVLSLAGVLVAVVVDLGAATSPDGPLAFTAIVVNVLCATAPLVLSPARAMMFAALWAVVIATGVSILHPDWDPTVSVALAAEGLALSAGGLYFARTLHGFARTADLSADAAEQARTSLAVARAAGSQIAHDARLLHDTLINTLAAIARGGAAVGDVERVQQRCAREVETVELLLAGRPASQARLSDAASDGFLQVRRTGISDTALAAHEASLPPGTVHAFRGAVEELVRNAEKHSGADHVHLNVDLSGDELTVTVTDDGSGFDGRTIAGRGLQESVLRRAAEAGIRVTLDTAPGDGTRVTLRHDRTPPPTFTPRVMPVDRSEELVAGMRRTAMGGWAVAMVGSGLAFDLVARRGQLTETTAMLVLIGTLCAVAWVTTSDGRQLPEWLAGTIAAAVPVSFILGFIGIGFGRDQPYLWQPISITPLLVTLLIATRNRIPLASSLVALAFTAPIVGALVLRVSPGLIAIVPVAVAILVAQFYAVATFHRVLEAIVRRSASDQQDAATSRVEGAVREAVLVAQRRWRDLGVRSSLDAIRPIASGEASPTDPAVRAACADEERHLRQLTHLLGPDLLRVGEWLIRALSEARSRAVQLTLRTSGVDAPDERSAAMLGEIVLAAVRSAQPKDDLRVSLFGTQERPELYLVGRPGFADTHLLADRMLPDWQLLREQFLDQELIEVSQSARLSNSEHAAPTPTAGTAAEVEGG